MKNLLPLPFLAATLSAGDRRPLGDEFANPATLTRFTEHGAHEGWTTPFAEQAAIHSPTADHFRPIPRTCAWF